MAPGNSVGTVNVSGNLTLAAGSTYAVEVSPTAADQTLVSGTATVTGSALQFSPLGGAYTQRTYTLLTANGGLTGTFATVNYGAGFTSLFTPSVSYDADDVYLTLTANSFQWSAAPSSSDWNTMGNWSANTVPGAGSAVVFDATSNANVTISAPSSAASLTFNAAAPTYTIAITGNAGSAASLTLTNGITDNSGKAQTITVGGVLNKTGTLTFNGGGTAADAVLVANSFGTIAFNGSTDAGAATNLTANAGGTIDFSGTIGTAGNNQVNAGSIAGGGNIVLGPNNLTVGASATSTIFSGTLSGSGSLTKIGSGTLTLGASNSYTGGTTITGGLVNFSALASFGTGNVTLNGGGVQWASASSADISSRLTALGAGGGTFDTNGNAVTLATAITGGGGLTKVGSGTLNLTASNTYTGGTIISAGTVQVGNGATSGSIVGNVVDNGALNFLRSDSVTFAGSISGTGTVSKVSSGLLILTGTNTYTGGTLVSGVLQIGNGGTTGSITGNVNDSGTLVFDRSDTVTFAGVISNPVGGALTQAGTGTLILTGANSYFNGTTISAGTLQIGSGGTAGALGSGAIVDNGALVIDRSDTMTLASAISGNGTLAQAGTGTLILTAADSRSGATTISAGTLQIGSGGTSGSIAGAIADNGALIFDRSDTLGYGGGISGSGSLTQAGSGTLTLSAANTFTGGTNVKAGTLNVTGSIGAVSVSSGGTLSGNGKVGAVSIASGGTIAPRTLGGGVGTMTVQGNLSLASGVTYVDGLTVAASDLASVSGNAGINGALQVNAASGAYTIGTRYTLLTASGGVSGTFASLATTGLPGYEKGRVSYDANDVFLFIDPNALTPLLPTGASANQLALAGGIDAAIKGGATFNSGIIALFNLSGTALTGAVDQISGQVNANASTAMAQSFDQFLLFMPGHGAEGGASFAPGQAYGDADAPQQAQLSSGTLGVWGSAYGGNAWDTANASSGAAKLTDSNVGFMAGAETKLENGPLLGGSAAFGSQSFSSGNGKGDSTDIMVGAYASQDVGEAGYIAGSLAYGWHDVSTARTVTVSSADVLKAKFTATEFGGRVEGGWRFAMDSGYSVVPYAAFAGSTVDTPAYAESVASGSGNFALAYNAASNGLAHLELGSYLTRAFELSDDGTVHAQGRLAWNDELDSAPVLTASFQGMAGSSFQAIGTRGAVDAALLGVGLHVESKSGLNYGADVETETGSGGGSVTGMAQLSWTW